MGLSLCLCATIGTADTLEKRFSTPPAEARPWLYWYWMNGNVTREGIRADLQAFADVGVGSALTFERRSPSARSRQQPKPAVA